MTSFPTNSPNDDHLADLENHIKSSKWSDARQKLFELLSQGMLDVTDYDLWGQFAGDIDRGLAKNWHAREQFWRALCRRIRERERATNTRTHKGLIYFKIGGMSLLAGKSILTGIKWLRLAYKEDEILYDELHQSVPQDQSARRLLVILKAFRRFLNGIRNQQGKQVQQLINLHRTRVARLFVEVFDKNIYEKNSGTPTDLRGLSRVPFDRLLGRNPYRVVVQQNYDAARWLCGKESEMSPVNLEKYGLAQAVVVLCGSTIEGLLYGNPSVRLQVRKEIKRDKPNYTLSWLVLAYLQKKSLQPELVAGLVFLWFARDLIHPKLGRKHYDLHIDMNFAEFVWELTGAVIKMMAVQSRSTKFPRKP
ncbi:MAG: hypothetical protein O2807_09610 [bacterium]|nr:hypothetical protein [bacterium]